MNKSDEFEIGQTVECVDSTLSRYLTKGKRYEVRWSDHTYVWVLGDHGREIGAFTYRFKAVEPTINPDEWHPRLAECIQMSYGLTAAEVLAAWCFTNMAIQLLAAWAAPAEPPAPPRRMQANPTVGGGHCAEEHDERDWCSTDRKQFRPCVPMESDNAAPAPDLIDRAAAIETMRMVAAQCSDIGRWAIEVAIGAVAAVEGMESGGERP